MRTRHPALPLTAALIAEGGTVLQGLHIVHVNHRLEDVHAVSSLLEAHGATVTFVGLPYDEREWPLRPLRASWREQVVQKVRNLLTDLRSEDVAVVEDGAYAIEAAASSNMRLRFAVEQTRFGHEVACALFDSGALTFPVLSCARSTVKCRVESQFLAIRLGEILSAFLTEVGEFLVGKKVLLIGYGILGRPLALRLSSAYRCRVSVVEIKEAVADVALADGFKVADSITASDDSPDVVVGVTGTESVGWPELSKLASGPRDTPLVLASVSSGDVEFRRALIDGAADDNGLQATDQHRWGVRLAVDNREILLFADGRPLNFFHRGSPSLAAAAADLIDARLVEALLFEARQQPSDVGRVDSWSTVDGSHPWLSEERFLSRFCDAVGISTLGCESAVSALRDIGLYEVHPAEAALGVGVPS